MKLLSDEQLDQILELSREGKPIMGTAIFKMCYDLKNLRLILRRIIETEEDKGLFGNYKRQRQIDKIIEEIKRLV